VIVSYYLKAKEKEAVKGGKKPFFLKKSEKKRQDLVQRYQDLKTTGGLEKAMAKKRKKNAAKDHRYVPTGGS
jgi:ribosomal RNA-processing protein 36